MNYNNLKIKKIPFHFKIKLIRKQKLIKELRKIFRKLFYQDHKS